MDASSCPYLAWPGAHRYTLRAELGSDSRKRVQVQAVQLRESEQRFRHFAQHDPLTGLASRLVLEDQLRNAAESVRRH